MKLRHKLFPNLSYYWYIDTTVDAGVSKFYLIDGKMDEIDKFNYSIGNFFKTRKEANKALQRLKDERKEVERKLRKESAKALQILKDERKEIESNKNEIYEIEFNKNKAREIFFREKK